MSAAMVAAYLELEDPATVSSGRRTMEAAAGDLAYTLELMGSAATEAAEIAAVCFYGPDFDRLTRENVEEAVRRHGWAVSSRDPLQRRGELDARAYFMGRAWGRVARLGEERREAARIMARLEAVEADRPPSEAVTVRLEGGASVPVRRLNPAGRTAGRFDCPTCKRPDVLSRYEAAHGYQCGPCTRRDEGI